MIIRPMQRKDVSRLIELGHAMHEESRFARFSFDEMKLRILADAIDGTVDSPWTCIVAEDHNEVIGMIVAYTSEFPFSSDIIASDFVLYVTPTHRGTTAAFRLVQAYEAWAKHKGACLASLGVSTGVNQASTAKLYERLGYNEVGQTFWKEI